MLRFVRLSPVERERDRVIARFDDGPWFDGSLRTRRDVLVRLPAARPPTQASPPGARRGCVESGAAGWRPNGIRTRAVARAPNPLIPQVFWPRRKSRKSTVAENAVSLYPAAPARSALWLHRSDTRKATRPRASARVSGSERICDGLKWRRNENRHRTLSGLNHRRLPVTA